MRKQTTAAEKQYQKLDSKQNGLRELRKILTLFYLYTEKTKPSKPEKRLFFKKSCACYSFWLIW